MKTKEFIAKVEALGFLVYDGHCYLEVKDTEGKDVVDILKAKRWVYDCEFDAFESLHEVKQTELMEFVTEYVTTQVKDREEEEKRYWLQKIPVPLLDKEGEKKWLWEYTGMVPPYIFGVDTTKIDRELYKTIFTESEIAQMDITGFVKVEVTEC